MEKEKLVYGTINIECVFIDTFNDSWNENEIEEYVKEHYLDYLEDIDIQVYVDNEETISYEDATADYYHDSMMEGAYEDK